MSEAVDKLMSILRKKEYEESQKEDQILQESATNLYNGIKADAFRRSLPQRRSAYELAYAKDIICECVGDLFVSSLVIDNPEKYSDCLKSEMRNQCMELMESAGNIRELYNMFSESSQYVKDIFPLIESILDTKTDEEIDKFDGKVFLNPDDKKMIDEFEKDSGKDTYAEGIQNRVIDVYKKEQECGEERKQKVQAIVDELAKIAEKKNEDGEPVAECVEKGMNSFGAIPTSLFNSIFVNKSKMVLNENASANIMDNAEEILAETICTYTLLECINSLGLKKFSDEDVRKLKFEFFVS